MLKLSDFIFLSFLDDIVNDFIQVDIDKAFVIWLSIENATIGIILINYIKEVHNLDDTSSVGIVAPVVYTRVYPNPTTGIVTIEGSKGIYQYNLSDRPAGVYILNVEGRPVKVVKR